MKRDVTLKWPPDESMLPKCCAQARILIRWEEHAEDKFGPKQDGWTCAVNMCEGVNVFFCPFCGKKLPKRI